MMQRLLVGCMEILFLILAPTVFGYGLIALLKCSLLPTYLHLNGKSRLESGTCPRAVKAGLRCIVSNQGTWYLDHLDVTWDQFYMTEPLVNITDPDEQKLLLGGEVCMWGETVDASDLLQTIWPRAAAAAGMYNTFLNSWYGYALYIYIYIYTHIPYIIVVHEQLRHSFFQEFKTCKSSSKLCNIFVD